MPSLPVPERKGLCCSLIWSGLVCYNRREDLLQLLDKHCSQVNNEVGDDSSEGGRSRSEYDFVYLPVDFRSVIFFHGYRPLALLHSSRLSFACSAIISSEYLLSQPQAEPGLCIREFHDSDGGGEDVPGFPPFPVGGILDQRHASFEEQEGVRDQPCCEAGR